LNHARYFQPHPIYSHETPFWRLGGGSQKDDFVCDEVFIGLPVPATSKADFVDMRKWSWWILLTFLQPEPGYA
jgi:hypothetical protein